MSKSVTNLMVGRLVQQGEVALSDDHLRPEWTDERADITIDQLLRMTSGLEWDETYDLGTPITQMLYREPRHGRATSPSQPSAHDPGTYQQYSSGSHHPALRDPGRAAPGRMPTCPASELFAPLGLSSAVLEPDAVGHAGVQLLLWATPRDWAAVGQFALQDGVWNGERLLPEGWMAESTTAIDVDDRGGARAAYGAGWWLNTEPDGDSRRAEPSRGRLLRRGSRRSVDRSWCPRRTWSWSASGSAPRSTTWVPCSWRPT